MSDASRVRPRVGFVIERTLGHATYAGNLISAMTPRADINAVVSTIDYETESRAATIPVIRNWTVQAGWKARRAVRRMCHDGPLDALFVHTQVPAVLMPDVLRRTPTVVSLDATPRQYDELGEHYDHVTGWRPVEQAKYAIHRRCFELATKLVTWSEWAKEGLVNDYRVPADKVVVIPPGIDLTRWDLISEPLASADREAVHVLFVGGDFERKGGFVLLEAVRRLSSRGVRIEVDIVTRDEVQETPMVRVHRGLVSNSPALIELYRRADVFCLPTRADCLGIVFAEAGAMGIPSVATDVGAVREIVRHEHSGLLVPVDDAEGLADAIERLKNDRGLRRRLGAQARRLVVERFNNVTNSARLVDLVREVAGATAVPESADPAPA